MVAIDRKYRYDKTCISASIYDSNETSSGRATRLSARGFMRNQRGRVIPSG